jgi:hypothetical protein
MITDTISEKCYGPEIKEQDNKEKKHGIEIVPDIVRRRLL